MGIPLCLLARMVVVCAIGAVVCLLSIGRHDITALIFDNYFNTTVKIGERLVSQQFCFSLLRVGSLELPLCPGWTA